jgi:hypothetical protein
MFTARAIIRRRHRPATPKDDGPEGDRRVGGSMLN